VFARCNIHSPSPALETDEQLGRLRLYGAKAPVASGRLRPPVEKMVPDDCIRAAGYGFIYKGVDNGIDQSVVLSGA
jgi:hypothetical protein